MKGKSKIPFIRLVQKFDPNMLCPACEVICTADSRHCYICNQCVERFDHHCPWVNNCIGINNHSYFYFYIITQTFYLILILIMAVFNITLLMSSETLVKARTTVMFPQIVHSDVETAQITYDLTLVLTILLTIFFLPFLVILDTIQTQNFMRNQTTNTRFSNNKNKRQNVSEQMLATLADDDTSCEDESLQGGTQMNNIANRA